MANLLNKRFTKALTEEMARTIANSMHNETIEQLKKEARALGDVLYKDVYAKQLKLIESLPEGFLVEMSGTYVNLVDDKGDHVEAIQARFNVKDSYNYKRTRKYKENYSSSKLSVDFTKSMRFPHNHGYHGQLTVPSKNPLIRALLENQDNFANAQAERSETIDQMQEMLAELGNFTALYASWPAVREILVDHEPSPATPKSKALPPATAFDDLNKKLGIPSKKAMTVSA